MIVLSSIVKNFVHARINNVKEVSNGHAAETMFIYGIVKLDNNYYYYGIDMPDDKFCISD